MYGARAQSRRGFDGARLTLAELILSEAEGLSAAGLLDHRFSFLLLTSYIVLHYIRLPLGTSGWDPHSIPTVEKLRELGMDLPESIEVIEEAKKKIS